MNDELQIKLTEFYCPICEEIYLAKPDGNWAGIHKKCGEMGQFIHKKE